MLAIVASHARRYPLWRAPDVYKLLHQSTLGSEHAFPSAEAARRWLEQEIAELPPGPDEPSIDPIRPDGSLARIHLRPYLAGGFDPCDLLEAFLRTAAAPVASPESLAAVSRELTGATGSELSLTGESIQSFLEQMRASGFPAVHHSPEYVEAYRPAYRVVAVRFLPRGLRREPTAGRHQGSA